MRTTVTLDEDVAAAIDRLRSKRRIGLSEAVPGPTDRHADIFGALGNTYQLRGNLVSDAQLATLAIEHGLTVCSADTDFARFGDVRWENPLARS